MKRPLLMVALFYGAGILLADRAPVALPILPLLAGSSTLALLALSWERGRRILIWPLLLLVGATNLTRSKAILSPSDLRVLAGDQPEIVSVRGLLCETPYRRVYEHHEEQSWRTLGQLEVVGIRRKNHDWQPATGRLTVSTPGLLPAAFFGGRLVEIEGVLRRPRLPVAQGLFDYGKYLSRQGIYHQLEVSSTNDWQCPSEVTSRVGRPVADRFGAWAQGMLARGLPGEDEPLRLLWAMTLGWKTALGGEVSEPFMRSGTMHIFAISGLHIALIAGLLVAVLRVFRVPRAGCGLLVIPLIWAYTGLTGWQASAIRSTIMMSVIIAGWSLQRPSDLLNSLAAAAFIILLWDPQQLFQASFQLSFFVVLSLALFTPVLEDLRRRWLAHDPWLPDELVARWRRRLRPPLDWVTTGLAVSLAAWLGSIPLIACYFHLFTPISLVANLVVVPLSSAALACNLASLAMGALLPGAAELFNHSAWFFMLLMIRVSEWAAHVPGGCFHIAAPTVLSFTLYYAVVISVMAGWLARPTLRVGVGGGLVVLGMIWLLQWKHGHGAARLTVLPLNGGEAIYGLPSRSSEDWLIDCGDRSAAEFVLKPFLRGQGANHVAKFLLTHGAVHHVGGAWLIHEQFAPRQVLFSAVSFRSDAYRQLVQSFKETPGLSKTIRLGDRLGPWTVLHPDDHDHFAQADDNAVVLLGELEQVRVLLLSDLGKPGQNALMERKADLRADIVVAGVPSRSEPLADALLDVIQPQLILITDSEYPATRRASRKLRERLAGRNVPVFYTRETGAVTVTAREGRWEVQTMNGARYSATHLP